MTTLLTPDELAAQYKISVKRIYALVRSGKLRAVKLPGSRMLRFDPDKLEPLPVAPKLLSLKRGRTISR